MPQQQRNRSDQQSRAVVADGGQRAPNQHEQRALVLREVTREIDNRLSIIQASAAAGVDPDRLKLVALTAFTRNPSLLECEPVSVARAIVEAGQLGLEPTGLLGGAYLVPRGGQATLLVGYRGLVILAKRSGEVQRVEARVVRAKDAFEYEYGLEPRLVHRPSRDDDPGDLSHAYAVIVYRSGERQFDVMTKAEIEAIRGRSSAARSGPWVTDYFEMCKKTVLRRLMKLAPLTVEVARRLDELDPEVDESPAAGRATNTRQAELRQALQGQLEREYGTSPTTRAIGAGTASGPTAPHDGPPAATGDGAQQVQPTAPPPSGTAAAPAADRQQQPERASVVLAACGVSHAGLGVGPCVLPAGHEQGPWKDTSGNDHEPQTEHAEAGGTRWTMPRQAGA